MTRREPTLHEAQNCLNWNAHEHERATKDGIISEARLARLEANITSLITRFPDLKRPALTAVTPTSAKPKRAAKKAA